MQQVDTIDFFPEDGSVGDNGPLFWQHDDGGEGRGISDPDLLVEFAAAQGHDLGGGVVGSDLLYHVLALHDVADQRVERVRIGSASKVGRPVRLLLPQVPRVEVCLLLLHHRVDKLEGFQQQLRPLPQGRDALAEEAIGHFHPNLLHVLLLAAALAALALVRLQLVDVPGRHALHQEGAGHVVEHGVDAVNDSSQSEHHRRPVSQDSPMDVPVIQRLNDLHDLFH
mmetsp:Transcript_11530/g.39761  ORF Transcript_11530/g.39761 Transcript_11530/m.39761 type:complete len:225 (+) Transcript_11530:7148-7822(+)